MWGNAARVRAQRFYEQSQELKAELKWTEAERDRYKRLLGQALGNPMIRRNGETLYAMTDEFVAEAAEAVQG